ncbi:MAG TPA: zinc metallopeptidase [Planctomycetota bacterium]|jgi:Zn-dependent membrane protease YugP|nr:zinc metallopeptidase [Planctomycetota bacterium]
MWFFDPTLLLFIVPGLLIGLWAQARVRSAYARASRIRSRRGMTGLDTARTVLDAEGVHGVKIGSTPGLLSDHYNPLNHELRLSEQVYRDDSLAAVGVAAHEAGHAIQHAQRYAPMYLRSAIVPLCTVGSVLGQIALGFGVLLAFMGFMLGQWLLLAGIIGYALVFLFTLVTLPVEFNASRRARLALANHGLVDGDEMVEVKNVLNAAALTYVASTVSVLGTLLQLLFLYNRSRD